MRRFTTPIILLLITESVAICLGQFPAPTQVDQRVSPVYPRNQSYQFLSSRNGSSPYQFNWYTGRWDYVPVPYGDAGTPYYRNNNADNAYLFTAPAQTSPPGYTPVSPAPAGGQGPIQNGINAAVQPESAVRENDEGLWVLPATRPTTQPEAKTVTFQGKPSSIRATTIEADARPHLLLRLHGDAGANGTVDIGNRLNFPGDGFVLGADTNVTVVGKLGSLDRSPVIFADEITIGGKTFKVMRTQYGSE